MKFPVSAVCVVGLALSACVHPSENASENYALSVNPFIGTDFTGNTYPGAQVPFGMVQLSPDNGLPGWDRKDCGIFLSGQHDSRIQPYASVGDRGRRLVRCLFHAGHASLQ